jgi:hypothetical protein
MASQRLLEWLHHPGVFVFVGFAARAGEDVDDRWSFGELGLFQVTTEAYSVFVDLFFFAAFNAEHRRFLGNS